MAKPNAGLETVFVAEASSEFPRQSEASALELRDGSILIIWQQFRFGEGDSDFWPSQLAAMTSRDGGRTWGDYRVLVKTAPGDTNVYNPNLLRMPTGEVFFFWQAYHKPWEGGSRAPSSIHLWASTDEARTFKPLSLVTDHQAPSLASSIVKCFRSGRIMLPFSSDTSKGPEHPDHYVGGVLYSDDAGRSWKQSRNVIDLPMRGVMETHVEETRDGRVLMVMRTQLGAVFMSESADGGDSWSKPQTTGLRAPESCPDILRIPSTGDLLMVWNNAPYDPSHFSHYGKRTPLTTAVSRDEGRSWQNPKNIETDPDWAFTNPGTCSTSKGTALINYWCSKYKPSGAMDGEWIHLKLAIVDVEWFYK